MMYHTAPQHFSSSAGPVLIKVFNRSMASAGLDTHALLVRGKCLPIHYAMMFVEEFQRSLKGIRTRDLRVVYFCYNTERPLRYHRVDSVVVFRYYNTHTMSYTWVKFSDSL